MTFTLDIGLKPYATDRQWEYLEAWAELGSATAAAKKLEVNRGTVLHAHKAVKRRAAKHGYSPEHDMTRTVPDGYKIRGVSTYYDKEGNVRGQWVKSAEDRERNEALMRAAAEAFSSQLPRHDRIAPPRQVDANKMTVYPVGDHHLGLLVWGKETRGPNYNLDLAEQSLNDAFKYLFSLAPNTERAAVVFLGDFLHYDSVQPVTPTGGNILDSDTRFHKMVRAAIRCMRFAIENAATKHAEVDVIVEVGNHDLSTSIMLMEALKVFYEANPRIRVDTNPGHFHYLTFGKNLIGTHHGHGPKIEDLPLIMAVDCPKEWGQSTHRMIFTGHTHSKKVIEVKGCDVEVMGILAPSDAYAFNKGYRAKRRMQAIVLRERGGEDVRITYHPEE